MEFEVGDKIRWNKIQRQVRGKYFSPGPDGIEKEEEEIVKIELSDKKNSTKLYMSNGYWINPECVEKVE
jgi:hypothetical protein